MTPQMKQAWHEERKELFYPREDVRRDYSTAKQRRLEGLLDGSSRSHGANQLPAISTNDEA